VPNKSGLDNSWVLTFILDAIGGVLFTWNRSRYVVSVRSRNLSHIKLYFTKIMNLGEVNLRNLVPTRRKIHTVVLMRYRLALLCFVLYEIWGLLW
jgi:hypothetical protein